MKLATGLLATALAVFFLLIIQEFIPSVRAFDGARVVLVPMVFCYVALATPTWAMLLAAVYTGFLSDLMYMHIVDGQVEIGLGWSIVYFVVFGLFAHGFQPAFLRGHWWLHVLLAAAGTSAFLALQYLMISFRRHGIVLNDLVVWRILGPGMIAGLLAPLMHFLVRLCGQFFPEFPQAAGGYRTRR
jgi:hypothetical protein